MGETYECRVTAPTEAGLESEAWRRARERFKGRTIRLAKVDPIQDATDFYSPARELTTTYWFHADDDGAS